MKTTISQFVFHLQCQDMQANKNSNIRKGFYLKKNTAPQFCFYLQFQDIQAKNYSNVGKTSISKRRIQLHCSFFISNVRILKHKSILTLIKAFILRKRRIQLYSLFSIPNVRIPKQKSTLTLVEIYFFKMKNTTPQFVSHLQCQNI